MGENDHLPVPASGAGVELASLTGRVAAAAAAAEALAARDDDVDTADLTPEERRDVLNARRAELDAAREELDAATEALQAAFKAQLEATRAALTPLQEKADLMMSGVEALSLYLGSDEQVVLLRDGSEPPASTPVTVYQDVLFMDEEMALSAEELGLADATIDPGEKGWASFDEWLLESDDHVRQVCPTPRGIVAFRSARLKRDRYGRDPREPDGSEITHLLIVNGEQLAWVIASMDFEVGDRLVPARDEIEKHFYDRWRRDRDGHPERLRPGTPDWDRAQKSADATQRHYLKIALILQGIVDRTTLLSPLPDPELSFTSVDGYDAGHIVVVTSDDGRQLPSGVIPYPQWRARIVADLDRGQRVVFGHIPYSEAVGMGDYSAVIHPRGADAPERGTTLTVKRRKDGSFSASYRRTDKVWREVPVPGRPGWVHNDYVPSTGYATVSFTGTEDWVLPIDHPLVTTDAIEWYLTSRENRRHFNHMVPLLRSALRVLRAEEAAEAPFRELASAEVMRRHGVDETTATALLDAAIDHYKTKRREHRALLSSGTDSEAFTAVLDLVARRVAVDELVDDPGIVAVVEAANPNAMFIGRRPDGTYVAVTAASDTEDVYVHVAPYSAKRGAPGRRVEWTTAPDVRSWKTIRSTPRFVSWPRYVDVDSTPTGPELDEIVARLRERHPATFAVDTQRFWSWDAGSAVAYRAWHPARSAVIDEDHPLTGTNRPATVTATSYTWTRTPAGITLEERSGLKESSDIRTTTPPEIRESVLWTDEAARRSLWASAAAEWEVHAARQRALSQVSNAAQNRLADAWVERATDIEYRKFVTKYGAEAKGRWDGHQKKIAARLRFPHDRRVIDRVFDHAVEEGLLDDLSTTLPATFGELLSQLVAAAVIVDLDGDAIEDLADLPV